MCCIKVMNQIEEWNEEKQKQFLSISNSGKIGSIAIFSPVFVPKSKTQNQMWFYQ